MKWFEWRNYNSWHLKVTLAAFKLFALEDDPLKIISLKFFALEEPLKIISLKPFALEGPLKVISLR